MPLTQATLSSKILANVKTQFGSVISDEALLKKFTDAVAKAVVDEVQANLQGTTTTVTLNATVATTTGPASGPVTGTVTFNPGDFS